MTSTLHFRRFAVSLFVLFLLCALPCATWSAEPNQQTPKSQKAHGEAAQKGENEEKAPFDPSNAKDAGVRMPTPYDKFVALDQVLTKTKVAVDIDPDAFNSRSHRHHPTAQSLQPALTQKELRMGLDRMPHFFYKRLACSSLNPL